MSFLGLLVLAIGLAMDATAVSATRGLLVPRIRLPHVLSVAICFGGAQALMPFLGWQLGSRVGVWVEAWDHWVAFALLAAIGGKMLWDSRSAPEAADGTDPFGSMQMLILSVATSIDALAAGITLPMLGAALWPSVATIGVTTALLSAAGLYAGRHFGKRLGGRLDAVGGLLLIGLGLKILIEHASSS